MANKQEFRLSGRYGLTGYVCVESGKVFIHIGPADITKAAARKLGQWLLRVTENRDG